MPHSMDEGKKEFFVPEVRRLNDASPIQSVLDIGPGVGTYYDLLRPILPEAEFSAIEVFEPYVERYRLQEKYDTLLVGDVRETVLWSADLVILGDVLEHVEYEDALLLWDRARTAAQRAVLLSLPIVHYEQGEMEGNVHEAHLYHWSHQEVLTTLPGLRKWWPGSVVGCYIADPS